MNQVPMSDPNPTLRPSSPPPPPAWQTQPPSGPGSGPIVVVIAALMIAIAVVAAVVFVTLRSDDAASSPATTAAAEVAPTAAPTTVVTPATVVTATSVVAEVPTTTVVTDVPATAAPATAATAAPVTAPPPAIVDLFAGTQAADVMAQVAAARGASPLRVLRAAFYPEYAFVQVQDPSIPANVDEYSWRGSVGSPSPVRLVGEGDLEANLFDDAAVDWAVIPALVAAAPGQIGVADGEVTHVVVQRGLPFTSDIRIRVFVDGERGGGFVDAAADGTVLQVSPG